MIEIGRSTATVISVEERHETVRGYLDANGQAQTDTRSLGWFIRISNSSAISVGTSKPDLKAGDELILVLLKRVTND